MKSEEVRYKLAKAILNFFKYFVLQIETSCIYNELESHRSTIKLIQEKSLEIKRFFVFQPQFCAYRIASWQQRSCDLHPPYTQFGKISAVSRRFAPLRALSRLCGVFDPCSLSILFGLFVNCWGFNSPIC